MKDWVNQALEHSGLSQAELARELTNRFKWPDNRSILNKIVKGDRDLKADEMFDISKATGFPIPGGEAPEIKESAQRFVVARKVGVVAAGLFREVDEFDQSEPEEMTVPRDENFPNARQLVFTCEGDSMNELRPRPILPGDTLICTAYEDVAHRVVLRDGMVVIVQRSRDGGMMREWSVKQIEIYEDRTEFHPRSSNPKHKPIVVTRQFDADDGVSVEVIAVVRMVQNTMPGF